MQSLFAVNAPHHNVKCTPIDLSLAMNALLEVRSRARCGVPTTIDILIVHECLVYIKYNCKVNEFHLLIQLHT